MKKLLLFIFLAGFGLNAQTSMSPADIAAQAGNNYETLLTNVEYGTNLGNIQIYLQREGGMMLDKLLDGSGPRDFTQRFKKKILSGEEEQSYLYVRLINKNSITQKIEIRGDWIPVVKFFCGFWSRTLNFQDVKPGEVVSTRFLTDVATLTFPDANTAKITVVPAGSR